MHERGPPRRTPTSCAPARSRPTRRATPPPRAWELRDRGSPSSGRSCAGVLRHPPWGCPRRSLSGGGQRLRAPGRTWEGAKAACHVGSGQADCLGLAGPGLGALSKEGGSRLGRSLALARISRRQSWGAGGGEGFGPNCAFWGSVKEEVLRAGAGQLGTPPCTPSPAFAPGTTLGARSHAPFSLLPGLHR